MKNKINISVLGETGEHRKLLKIIPYGSGGFAIVLPRIMNTRKGRLEKTLLSYKNFGTHIDIKRDESEQYSANDIVKFSYHPDGFIQFSSTTNNKIISGRDPNGLPKGLGLLSWPLSSPISSGPSMTLTFWGLDKFFKELPYRVDERFRFDIKEATKHPKASFKRDDRTAYAMAFYIIPNRVSGNIINKNGKKIAHLSMMQSLPDDSYFMRLRELVRIIEIPKQNYRIAISWFLIPKRFKSRSGYIFSSPTDGKSGLVASYPAFTSSETLPMKDLGFSADNSSIKQ